MDLRSSVELATDRVALAEHDGRSGALLERRTLADGSRVVVKRYDAAADLVMRLTGDTRGREAELFAGGFFDRLPAGVGHAMLDAWFEDGRGVVVMRDLGTSTLGWDDVLDQERCLRIVSGVAALHRAFLGRPPEGMLPLGRTLGLFRPDGLQGERDEPLIRLALRGWDCWREVADDPVGRRVLALAQDPGPLLDALSRLPPTLLHGDLANVNMALEPDAPLTLIDWGLAGTGPGPVDLGRFLAGCGHIVSIGPDAFVDLYRAELAPAYDDGAIALGLLAGLTWLGWNKALDIVDSPDPVVRDRETRALAWWLERAAEALRHL